MRLYAAVQTAHGSRVKRAGILRRRRSLQSSQALWEFFTAYADETTKSAYVAPRDVPAANEGEYLRAVLAGGAPLRPEIDYLPGRSRVVAFGGAVDPGIYRTGQMEDLSDGERTARLRRWWLKGTADEAVKAHHLVFTLDPRLAAAMAEAGASADTFLLTAVSNAVAEFQSRFHPGDLMSYLVALHHDRAHIHAHVLVHPRTQNGARVSLSVLKRFRMDSRWIEVPCQQVLKDAFERESEEACEKFLPGMGDGLGDRQARREELAEELMLIARSRLEPDLKAEAAVEVGRLIAARERILGDPDCVTLIRQGRDAEAHLIAEDLADGRLYEIRHNFASIADKSAAAQFAAAGQARGAAGMFLAHAGRPSVTHASGLGAPLPNTVFFGERQPDSDRWSFNDEVRARARAFRESAEANDRLRHEAALLRGAILREDGTERECVIAAANTVLSLLEAATPALGAGPDLLTLWTPAEFARPRLRGTKPELAGMDANLSRVAAELAARHQPVNLADFGPSIDGSVEGEGDPQPVHLVAAQPGFWARRHEVHLEELLTLVPSAPAPDRSPSPG